MNQEVNFALLLFCSFSSVMVKGYGVVKREVEIESLHL